MDSRIIGTGLLVVGVLGIALSAIQVDQLKAFAKEDEKPILGVVIPGKTTLIDFENVLQAKGCVYSKELVQKDIKGEVTVPNGCFDLPGKPVIHAGSDRQGVVSILKIEWSSDDDGSLYNRYYLALEKSYGRPESKEKAEGWKKSLTWSIPKQQVCINLLSPGEEGHGVLNYVIGRDAQQSIEKFSHLEEKSDKDLERL